MNGIICGGALWIMFCKCMEMWQYYVMYMICTYVEIVIYSKEMESIKRSLKIKKIKKNVHMYACCTLNSVEVRIVVWFYISTEDTSNPLHIHP